MGVATFVEKYKGTPFVSQYLYGSWWFALLWAVLAVCGLIYFFRTRKAWHNIALHTSMVLILVGALLTQLTARHGMVHLREGETTRTFTMQKGDEQVEAPLPFSLTLKKFQVDYHNGTTSPSDYRSLFVLTDPSRHTTLSGQVSMNKIFTYHHIRLYQSSYDDDNRGSYLSVNDDPWGVPVTYAGYALLFVSLVWMLVSPRGGFRTLLRNPRLKKGLMGMALLLMAWPAQAADTLPRESAQLFGSLLMDYHGRICPMQTAAIDFTKKLCGKSHWKEYTADQVYTGFLFYPAEWADKKVIHVKSAPLRRATGVGEWASVDDFFPNGNDYVLGRYIAAWYKGEHNAVNKAAADIDDRLQLIMTLRNAAPLAVFPVTDSTRTERWYSPTSLLPAGMDRGQRLFVTQAFNLLYETGVMPGDWKAFDALVQKMKTYQLKYGVQSVPSTMRLEAETLYNKVPFADILFKFNLTVGVFLLLLLLRKLLKDNELSARWERKVQTGAVCLLALSFAAMTVCLVLRYLISGRLPMGNGYETMLVMAWCVQLVTLCIVRRFPYLLSFGFLLSGFFLLVSFIGQMDPQITPLVPVLSSPLLSVHVSLIMMSYALFSFTFLCAVVALILLGVKGERNPQAADKAETLQVVSRLFLYPALMLLGIGIFIGAIWANQSWGRYWGWDPKEVWALISFMLYAMALHSASLPLFRRPRAYHIYMVFCFLTILMTYIGVNYFLGGMHSYANG